MVSPRRVPRIAHLGLGAFARSHQAWYTQVAGGDWGITASTSRVTAKLAEQAFRYSLIERGAEVDSISVIESVVDVDWNLEDVFSEQPEIAILTLTVTEAGYLPGAFAVRDIVEGLEERRMNGGGPLAIVPCDNVPSNGVVLRTALLAVADERLGRWITDNVSFVSTMVDRITPAATAADISIAAKVLGWYDAIPVVTEPFTEWVLQGDFPAGRPEWEKAGAQFVADVEPYENRKLWLLNAAHSLLAYRGLETGHQTVFDAWADPVLAAEVEQLWVEAREVLPLPAADVDRWLGELRIRWQNPRIEHRLVQIAQGGEQKVLARIGTVIERRREAGLSTGTAEFETIAAWERFKERSQ